VWLEPHTPLVPRWRMGFVFPPFLLGMWWESLWVFMAVKLQNSEEKALLFTMDFKSNLELHELIITM
jgi:hypothetical protein